MMKKGFTLVELAIVLVIIGLLIGGILAAQSMIATAQVNKYVHTLSQLEIGINNFKTNYRYEPGDAPSFDPTGNGDGIIDTGGAGENSWAQTINSNTLPADGFDLTTPSDPRPIFSTKLFMTYNTAEPMDKITLGYGNYTGNTGMTLCTQRLRGGLDYKTMTAIDHKIDNGNIDDGNFFAYLFDQTPSMTPCVGDYGQGCSFVYFPNGVPSGLNANTIDPGFDCQ